MLIRSLARVDAALPPRDPPTPRAGQRLDTPAYIFRQELRRFGFSGDDVNERDGPNGGTRPLHEAARDEDERFVASFLAAGAEVDGLNDYGASPLQYACLGTSNSGKINLGAFRLLIAANADVNHRDTDSGKSVLHWAIDRLHWAIDGRNLLDAVTMLLEAGADATVPNDYGWTPLHCAARRGNAAVAKALIAAGADPNTGSQNGPPYAMALEGSLDSSHLGYRSTLRVLLQHGAVPDAHAFFRRCPQTTLVSGVFFSTRDYHEKVKAAGGYDALVKQHRRILASVVDKVVEAKFGRRAPQEVCAHAALFIAPPGGS